MTGPNPVDRNKAGSKLHVLADATGIPLVLGISSANTHDSQSTATDGRRDPPRSDPSAGHGDAGQRSSAPTRAPTSTSTAAGCASGIIPRIGRRGIETTERLGTHRWKIERTIAWLTGYRRLTIRYERHSTNFAAFLTLAASLTCWKKLTT